MKKLIYIPFALIFCHIASAQEKDSITVEETAPTEQLLDNSESNDISNSENESEPRIIEENVEPRIIYYPNSDNTNSNNYSNNSYRYSGRNGSDIKTLSGNMHHSGGFWAASFRTTEFRDEATVLAGMRAGWIINRTLGIGIEGHGIIPTAKFDDISSEGRVVLLGGYGGMFMEFILFSNQVVHITFPISGGAGWLGYNKDWEEDFSGPTQIPDPQDPDLVETTSDLIDDDVFWYVEPGANLELNVSRNFRMAFGVSKRITQDMELISTDQNAFEKLNYYVTLKVGKF